MVFIFLSLVDQKIWQKVEDVRTSSLDRLEILTQMFRCDIIGPAQLGPRAAGRMVQVLGVEVAH